MNYWMSIFTLLLSPSLFANSTILSITDYDDVRQRANISVSSDLMVPVGTKLRINAKSGDSCIIEVIERINTSLIAKTPDCNGTIVRPGLKLAYSDGREPAYSAPIASTPISLGNESSDPLSSNDDLSSDTSWGTTEPPSDMASTNDTWNTPPAKEPITDPNWGMTEAPTDISANDNDWPSEGKFSSPSASAATTSSTSASILPESMAMLRDRLSVYIGHNFSSNLEGKVYADGTYKDLGGNTAFSLGVQGRVYDITPKISVAAGLGYEFARNFDEATLSTNGVQFKGSPLTGNPRLTLWSLYSQVEGELLDKLVAFGGLNVSIPFISQVTWDAKTDLGFQAGANYQVYDRIRLEALIKISNINLKNQFGETTDVSLAGLELRGRYTF